MAMEPEHVSFVDKRLIWVGAENFSGWCCSHCTWAITAPRMDSTVAALAFNRVAQQVFDKHTCDNAHGDA